MQRTQVGLDTLLILLRKGATKLRRYEAMRSAADNVAADRMIPEMFELRNDIVAAYRGALHADDPAERPSDQVMEQVQFLLRALAPGIRRPASETNLDSTRIARRNRVRRAASADSEKRRPEKGSLTSTLKLTE